MMKVFLRTIHQPQVGYQHRNCVTPVAVNHAPSPRMPEELDPSANLDDYPRIWKKTARFSMRNVRFQWRFS